MILEFIAVAIVTLLFSDELIFNNTNQMLHDWSVPESVVVGLKPAKIQ